MSDSLTSDSIRLYICPKVVGNLHGMEFATFRYVITECRTSLEGRKRRRVGNMEEGRKKLKVGETKEKSLEEIRVRDYIDIARDLTGLVRENYLMGFQFGLSL